MPRGWHPLAPASGTGDKPGMFEVAMHVALLLILAAFAAGFIDSIAGGGGLISVPALLLAGASPVEALATNKLQGTFGAGTAMLTYGQVVNFFAPGGIPAGYAPSLPRAYLVWALLVLLLYPLCAWYDRYKRAHPDKTWLRYL